MYDIRDRAAVIREIKRYLYDVAHFLYKDMKSTTIDGIYDAESAEVVRDYQRIRGIPVNGSVDYITFLALAEDYKSTLADKARVDYVLTGEPFPLSRGDYSDDVRVINLLISELGKTYRALRSPGRGGYYSAYTAAAVRELRRIFMMEESDEVDKRLYNRMLTELDAIKRNASTGDLKKKEWV